MKAVYEADAHCGFCWGRIRGSHIVLSLIFGMTSYNPLAVFVFVGAFRLVLCRHLYVYYEHQSYVDSEHLQR